MESFKQQTKQPEIKELDETNEQKIIKDFVEMPSDKVELLASHLMRPDGFIKALIIGKILTSEEISKNIDHGFMRTHRGYYMTHPKPEEGSQNRYALNDYISFSIGIPQTMYTRTSNVRAELGGTSPGLGFMLPASELLEQTRVTPSWGMFNIEESIKKIKKTKSYEKQFDKYRELVGFFGISSADREKYEWHTPKEDFLPLTNLARKAGKLYGGDQAEVNMWPENGTLPQIEITDAIILIPLAKREALKRLFEIKRKKIEVFCTKIQEVYGVDVNNISFEDIEKKYAGKIYWYPQKNISLAVQYLTTHPQKIKEFYTETK